MTTSSRNRPADHEQRRKSGEGEGGQAGEAADHHEQREKTEAVGMELDVRHGAPEQQADAKEQAREETEMALGRDAHRIAGQRLSEQHAVEPDGHRQ